MVENNGQRIYTKYLDKNNNIVYARETEDKGMEYFTLIQFGKKETNDVSLEAFEMIKQDHNMQQIGTITASELLEKL